MRLLCPAGVCVERCVWAANWWGLWALAEVEEEPARGPEGLTQQPASGREGWGWG